MESCTAYVEGYPEGYELEELGELFKEFKVCDIRMPKFKDLKPKGFAFVEFQTKESMD